MLKVFCTKCKPEFEVKPSEHSLADQCPCGNVTCNWLIEFGKLDREHFSKRQPFRINSFDSKYYRVERDGVNITGKGTMRVLDYQDEVEDEEE